MARRTNLSIVRAQLSSYNLTDDDTLFVYALFQISKNEEDPITHHIFCDEVASIMTKLSDENSYDEHDVQNYVAKFKERPFRFVATNGRRDCAGFRVTDFLIDWYKKIGIMK